MKRTFNNTNMIINATMAQAEAMIDANCDKTASALDLTVFNEAHGNRLRLAAAAQERYKKARRFNCWFDRAIIVMMVSTAIACCNGLLTMMTH